jgi:RNA-directed DNA polymerase
MRPSNKKLTSQKKTLYRLLCEHQRLESAWQHVRSNALRSDSAETRAKAKEFEIHATSTLRSIQSKLTRRSFRFAPVRGIVIEKKGASKKRPIVVAPIESRIVQRAILEIVQEIPEVAAKLNAGFNFGGVSGEKSGVPSAVKKAFSSFQTHGYFIRTDIRSFFVSVPRRAAVSTVTEHIDDFDFKNLFVAATKTELEDAARYGEDVRLFPLYEQGVAQGSCLSPMLCNLLLSDFDKQMNDRGVVCIRYIDDFVLFAKDQSTAFKAFDSALAHLSRLGLSAYDPRNPEAIGKAEHGSIETPLLFLGCEISRPKMRPSREAFRHLLAEVKSIFDVALKSSKRRGAQSIDGYDSANTYSGAISRASKVIRGWGNTYWFCNDLNLIASLDSEIDKLFAIFHSSFLTSFEKWDSARRRHALGLWRLQDCKSENNSMTL